MCGHGEWSGEFSGDVWKTPILRFHSLQASWCSLGVMGGILNCLIILVGSCNSLGGIQ